MTLKPFQVSRIALRKSSFVASTSYKVLFYAAPIRKRDRVKNAVKNLFRSDKNGEAEPDQQAAPTRPKMRKAQCGKKYAKIECMEEKAYQILKDLDMIEQYN